MTDQQRPIRIFYSYTHKDASLREELEMHLATLKRSGIIQAWSDRDITGGQEWAGEISQNLEAADIILLLVSPDFLASDYCYDKEMARALAKHKTGTVRVIPIVLRPIDLENTPFSKLQALPTGARAVTSWGNRDEAFLNVAAGVRRAVADMQQKAQPKAGALQDTTPPPFRIPENQFSKTGKTVKAALIGAAAVIIVALIGGFFLLHGDPLAGTTKPNLTPSPTSTQSAGASPHLATAYQGAVQNTTKATGDFVLTDITQSQQTINGQVFWGGLFVGDGLFTGTIASNGSAAFAENLSNGTITFNGTLASDGSFGGTYSTTLRTGGASQYGSNKKKG